MNIFVAVFLFLPSFVLAESNPAHVIQLEPSFSIEQMKAPGVVLHPLSEVNQKEETIPSFDRDLILNKSELLEKTKKWSALDKDLFMLRTEHQEINKVRDRYQDAFTDKDLLKLKRMIEAYRKSKAQK